MKKVGYLVLILLFVVMVTGCGKKITDGKEKELIPRPVVEEGKDIIIKDLKFFLPNDFIVKSNNGENGIYEYYTGDYVEFGPTGIDVYITHQLLGSDFNFDQYATTKSAAAIVKAKMKKVTINSHEWYKARVKDDYYYFGYSPEGSFDIHIRKYEDKTNLYDDTIKMFEETLFFENLEIK